MTALIDGYDMVSFDLDGVIYRGPQAVPHAVETLAELRKRAVRIGFVTNNAQRSPQMVADHLNQLGIACDPADVVTSAQATARVMAEQLEPGAEVLILGSASLAHEVSTVRLTPTTGRTANTAAICVGYDPTLTLAALNEGCFAVESGAVWYACNDDLNRPTESGLAIGMGGVLAAMSLALPEQTPIMGGKPARPLLDETHRRLGGDRILFVGDRLDTDIAGAVRAGWDSLFVLSGSHTLRDAEAAEAGSTPTYVGDDVSALLEEPRVWQSVVSSGLDSTTR
ncbi:MAG: HAD-IIA family hydrolase [Propionibacteriaceae bacterium]|jgi:HAD superfamily hydrolase (TIGR01450 family)|nr:HAD-IIA family hydrolase [Propionibacteriaceae bacterium]